MLWLNSETKHLPLSTGPFVPGCADVMLGYEETSPFFRLFYPTDAKRTNDEENLKKWIPWLPDDDYMRGIAKVVMVLLPVLRLIMWWNDKYLVPVLYGEKAKVDRKMPCVIMSHGLGGSRYLCSNICYEMASQGFLVVSLEHRDGSACHTYYYASEQEAAEDKRTFLPFKHISFGKNHYERRLEQVKQRTGEIGRVIDFLKDLNDGNVSRNVLGDVPGERRNSFDLHDLIGKLDLSSLAVMGHSFGGSTALYALYARQEFRYGILLDPWMFPVKGENLHEKLDKPILFVNTQTFHIQSNVVAMSKLMSGGNRKMFTILHTTHENQCDNALMFGCWLNLFMKKLDPNIAIKINNALILDFLHQYVGCPGDIAKYRDFLEEQKKNFKEGLTKPWA